MESCTLEHRAPEVMLESDRYRLQRTAEGFELIRREDQARFVFRKMDAEIEEGLQYITNRSKGNREVTLSLFDSMCKFYAPLLQHDVSDSEV